MQETNIGERITQLRMQKEITERQMSLDLGHSSSYIHSIASGRALPSMQEFLYICEYLEITPMEFFNVKRNTTSQQQRAIRYIYELNKMDTDLIVELLERISTKDGS